uniref:Uncharacterized protein n=1 Tax=Glossina pallidipes TaxID=7398 RepID=A0A1B0AJZ5_GLOPL
MSKHRGYYRWIWDDDDDASQEMYFTRPSLLKVYKKANENFLKCRIRKGFRLPSAISHPIKLRGNQSFTAELRSVLHWRITTEANNSINRLKSKTQVYTTESMLNYLLSFPWLRQTSDIWFLSVVRFKADLYIGDIKPCKSNFAATDRRLEDILYRITVLGHMIIPTSFTAT